MFGNAASVLVGDFLYSRAFQMMVSVNRMRVLEVLADATNVIAEGEVLQLMNMHDPDLAVADYLQVIRYKTAKLFEASARLGAVLAGAPPGAGGSLRRPTGARWARPSSWSTTCSTTRATATNSGKNVGDDLREGKPTLPLLIAMERAAAPERALIRHAIEHGEVHKLPEILAIVKPHRRARRHPRGGAEGSRRRARWRSPRCPPSRAREALLELCVRSIHRSS